MKYENKLQIKMKVIWKHFRLRCSNFKLLNVAMTFESLNAILRFAMSKPDEKRGTLPTTYL